MQQQTSSRQSSLAQPSLTQRAGLLLAGLALLVLVAVGSSAPWFGGEAGTPQPARSGQALYMVIDDQRVVVLSAQGTFHNDDESVIVSATSLKRSGPYFFTVSRGGSIFASEVPTEDTWSLTFDPARGVVIEAPDGMVGWVATTDGATFELEQPTGAIRPLVPDDPITTAGVDIRAAEVDEPPTFNPLRWAVTGVVALAAFLLIYGVPILVGIALLALLGGVFRYVVIPRRGLLPRSVALTSTDLANEEADLIAQVSAVTDVNLFIGTLRQMPDRRQAVQLAYSFLAIGQPGVPPRTPDATPLEWLAALSAHDASTGECATELVDRYLPVRFAGATPTETERMAAIDSLEATVAHTTGESAR